MIGRAGILPEVRTLLNWIRCLFMRQKTSENRHVTIPIIHALEWFGICGPNRRALRRFLIPLVMSIIVSTIPCVLSVINEDSPHGMMKKAGYSVLVICASINISVIAWKRETLDRLLLNLEAFFQKASTDENSEENKVIIHSVARWINVINRWYTIYYGIPGYIVFIFSPMVYTVINYILSPETASVYTAMNFNENDFYFDYTSKIWRVALFYVFQFPSSTFLYLLVLFDAFFACLVAVYCLPTFKITITMLKKLNEKGKPLPCASQIAKIVRSHDAALECIRLLEDFVHLVFLGYRISFLIIWCLVLFGIATYSDSFPADRIFAFLVSAFGKVLAMSFIGKKLNDLAEQLAFEVYNIRWYEMPNGMKKSVLLMLQRAQRPVGLTAGKFGYVDMESFADMMQTSYSFYLCLKSVIE